jgi:hypothetical protein
MSTCTSSILSHNRVARRSLSRGFLQVEVAGLFVGGALSADKVASLGFSRPNSLFQQLRPFQNDEFQLRYIQKQKACVTTYGPLGPITTCTYD